MASNTHQVCSQRSQPRSRDAAAVPGSLFVVMCMYLVLAELVSRFLSCISNTRLDSRSGQVPLTDELQVARRQEIETHLAELQMAVFYGRPRNAESATAIYWDCHRTPDYKMFLKAAVASGVKMVVYHARDFQTSLRRLQRNRKSASTAHAPLRV